MAARQPQQPHDDEPGYVLHAYAYRETSLIVEAFTGGFGRVAMVAKGAKRPRSEVRGLLQGFQPLTLSWAGAGELKTLTRAEWRGGLPLLGGSALLCGFYLNELLLKLLAREDPHPALFADYERALAALAGESTPQAQAMVLRRFEVRLLAELGYALNLAREVDSGAAIDPSRVYHYVPDRGPRLMVDDPPRSALRVDSRSGAALRAHVNIAREPEPRSLLVRGATLIALANDSFPDPESASEAKHLMREVIDHHLEERRIVSRRVVRDLMALDEHD